MAGNRRIPGRLSQVDEHRTSRPKPMASSSESVNYKLKFSRPSTFCGRQRSPMPS